MESISKKQIEVISDLEFRKKHYFTKADIQHHFKDQKQMYNTIYQLKKKQRIIPLNKDKYFLIPIKARTGKWIDNPAIIADEIMNSKEYFIGGWYAAKYWSQTDQIPAQVDIYTTKRQGKTTIMNKRFVFHRTTPTMIKKSQKEYIQDHSINILSKEDSKKWMKSKA